MAVLKPFVINLNDLAFLLKQVNFIPLFDAQGNAVINWNGSTPVYDTHNNLLSDGSGNAAANIQVLGRLDPITNTYVAGFPDVSAPIGVRDVTGFHNNLFGTQAEWGAVDVPFVRQIPADYSNYVTNDGNGGTADYSVIGGSVTDMMPRIISRTITTAGVNLLRDGANGPYVEWSSARYANDSAYTALIEGSGVDISKLVEGAKIVVPGGLSLVWDPAVDSASAMYGTLLAFVAARSGGGELYGAGGAALQEGGDIYYNAGTVGSPAYVAVGVKFDAGLLMYHSLVVASGASTSGLTAGDALTLEPADVQAAIASVDGALGVSVSQATASSQLVQESGYGLLETLGQIDFQNPDSGEYFIGSENPGVAPVNSWFGIFGQFFDHGLDFIGKGGNGTITIALDPTDPLYGKPGPDGQPVTSIKIARATTNTVDANGDAAYVNHTSPFIDQSQTYGSVDQVTNILREWVSTDGGNTFHAGMNLFDGTSLVDSWTRRWPDGTTQEVHDTLPTLNELRQHIIDTHRAEITWEDVSNLRMRDANGQLLDTDANTAGVQTGNSNHALLLDMNPGFTSGTFNASTLSTAKVADAVQLLKTHVQADNSIGDADGIADFGISDGSILGTSAGDLYITTSATVMGAPAGTYTGATALMLSGWIDHNFNIVAADPAVHAAVGEILMASVGAHYIAGDGRVNENFGLTSIHHVFHEEHNFQVENLKTWIYAHDLNNPGATDTHEQLHNWQDATAYQDDFGNYMFTASGTHQLEVSPGVFKTQANADNIAWDPDKMFEATKLVVEMEYQHAAVDQYARTVTPRIQEFVGYSSGVDSTISLEYAQVAFRFGHSTIRETIEAIDPSGWMLGHVTRYALEKAFLSPQTFADEGVAAITLGLSRQQMNEVDEFVTPALNQGLLGQPLDLPAINIARGRDLGIPTLNDFRAGIGLAEYTSWTDFGAGMYHPDSLVNFIAAYSFGGDVAKAEAIMGLAEGNILDGSSAGMGFTAADAVAFMNNNYTGNNAELSVGQAGFDHIDSWIGGLAEAHVPGGLLGETFDAVFVAQIQSLMDGDRFYYLYRLFGTQIHEEVNNGQFKDIVERNTGLTHLNGSIFAYADKYYDFNREADGTEYTAEEANAAQAPVGDHANHLYADLVANRGIYSDGGSSLAPNGSDISVTASDGVRENVTLNLIRDVRPDLQPDLVHPVEGTPTDGADSHEVIVATANADYIHARGGDDTVYGEEGDDYLYGDGGVDRLYGGDGDDMIDTGEGPDLADGGAGKDIIYGRGSGSEVGGFDQLVGGSGNDLIVGGEGIDKLSGGSGDDIIYGDGLTNPEMGNTDPFTHAGDGNDYIDGGASGDLLFGEEGDDYIVGGNDQDLMQGGQGDDIIRPGSPSQASGTTGGPDEVVGDDGQANSGFDLIDFSDYAGSAPGVTVDFATQNNPLVNIDQTTTFPAWFQIEGAVGSQNNDAFIGDSAGDATADNSQGNNWLIGGSGNDTFTGNGGNDLIVGGSIRLDALIGSYADAASASPDSNGHTNLALGSAEWLADAMRTGSTGFDTTPGTSDGYDNDGEDGYTGASNRATGDIGANGLIDAANALGGAQFDKHFTDMLQSRMFKDVVLGDGGTDGSADTVVFTGNLSEYSIEVINFTAPNGETIQALKVTDNGGLLDDGTGVLVPRASDGVDLIVGVETAIFADRPQGVSLIPTQPVLDLDADHVVTTTTTFTENFSSTSYTQDDGTWTQDWTEIGDNNGSGGDITITGGVLQFNDNVATGDSISRGVDLTGATSASLSFTWGESGADTGENILVEAFNGTSWDTLGTLAGVSNSNASGNETFALSATHTAIRFESSGGLTANETFSIDNIVVAKNISIPELGAAGTGHVASYTEGGARTAISASSSVSDDSANMAWAKVVLTNAFTGDALRMGNGNNASGNLGGGVSYSVDSSVAGQITLTITGQATKAQYQGFIDQVRFFNTSNTPDATDRTIKVTVNDGFWSSEVATTTVHVTPVNDAPNATGENVITNVASGTPYTVAGWALLANDTDPDGPSLSITNVTDSSNPFTAVASSGNVVVTDSIANGNRSFTYTVSDGATPTAATDTQSVGVTRDTTGSVDGNNSNTRDILIGDGAGSTFDAGTGDDIILAGGGDDTIVWNATSNTSGSQVTSDGHDIVDGGDGTDTFTLASIVNGTNGNETFDIYTLAEAQAAGITGLDSNSTIVITRNGGVAAELRNVEEIVINTGPGNNQFPNNTGTGDKIFVHGDFTGTGLAYSTITINDDQGGATVDISGLSSEHRIVFNTDANGQVIGETRPQDIVNHSGSSTGGGQTTGGQTAGGQTGEGEHASTADGGTTSVTHQSTESDGEGEDETEHAAPQGDANTQVPSGETSSGNGEHSGVSANGTSAAVVGTREGDAISVGEQKVVSTGDGDDVVTTGDGAVVHSGDGNDIVTTGDGSNVVLAGSGDDVVTTGSGNDKVFGEAGNDLIDSGAGDDMVWGGDGDDEIHAGEGDDRIESGAGTDLIFTGAGSDVIVYRNIADADGDTIVDFAPGDRIDLSFIDASASADGNNAFHFGTGAMFTGAGELIVAYDAANDLTSISGNTDANTATAEFQIVLQGDHVDQLKHGGVGL